MEIDVKVFDLLGAQQGFSYLREKELADPPLLIPFKIGLHLSRLEKSLVPELQAIEEQRLKILKQHAELDENGRMKSGEKGVVVFKDPEEGPNAFAKEWSDFSLESMKIDVILLSLEVVEALDSKDMAVPYRISALFQPFLDDQAARDIAKRAAAKKANSK